MGCLFSLRAPVYPDTTPIGRQAQLLPELPRDGGPPTESQLATTAPEAAIVASDAAARAGRHGAGIVGDSRSAARFREDRPRQPHSGLQVPQDP